MYGSSGVCGQFIILENIPKHICRMVWILMHLLSQYNSSLFCCYCFLWNSVNSLQYQNNKNMCTYLQAIKILQLCLPSFLCKEWVKSFQSNAFKKEEGQGNSVAGIRCCSLPGTCCRTETSCITLATPFFPIEAAADFLAPHAQRARGPWVQFCNLIIPGNLPYGWLG